MDRVLFPNTLFDLIVIASSAGGLSALAAVLNELPNNFPAALLIVQHLQADRVSLFPQLLDRKSPMPVRAAVDGLRLQPGTVFVCPSSVHLLVQSDLSMVLSTADAVDFHRPSADLLFESAARTCGARVIAVVLTGHGSDASRGANAIHAAGGLVIAQSPATSKYSSMPQSAINTGSVDYILPLEKIAEKLIALVHGEERP